MERRGYSIAGFIDSNKELHGKKRLGYEVFAPEKILQKNEGDGNPYIIVAAWAAVNEIAEELEKNTYVYGKDFEIFDGVKKNYKGLRKNKSNSFNINDLEIVENIGILFENEIVLYGAGKCGREVFCTLKAAGIPVLCFCDGDSNKQGQCINDIEIISPSKLKQLDLCKSIAIIIAIDEVFTVQEIIEDISALQLKTMRVYTKFALNISLLHNIKDCRINDVYRKVIFSISRLYFSTLESARDNESASYLMRIINETSNNNILLIYQPGKVGSSTIRHSVEKIGFTCIHTHRLNVVTKNRDIFKYFDKIRIITLVREPIGRGISGTFERLNEVFLLRAAMLSENSLINICIEHLKHNVFEYPFNYDFKYTSLNLFDWFDRELKVVFGIDIYAHPFDRENGYTIIKQGNIEVLAMKLEKLNDLGQVIGEFIGAPQFKLSKFNESDKRAHKYLYKNVKDTIKIPREIFDLHYNNPKMDHFYSEEEKAAFLKKWEKNIAD